jgi:ATP-dependent RNA helicase RhlE
MATDLDSPDFLALGLTADWVQRASRMGWMRPTAVQIQVLMPVQQGRDILALAPTGSGKTAAFLLPLLQRLEAEPDVMQERPRQLRVLVLAPTRELAAQIATVASQLSPALKTVLAVGGLSINPQMLALRGGAHVLVATPGRLLDLRRQNAVPWPALHTVVLDEADRLLDDGFADDTRRVLALLPRPRQTLMFSATMPDSVAGLAAQQLRDPLHVQSLAEESAEAMPAPDIAQRAIVVDTARRTPLLRHLIQHEGWRRVLVFVATQYSAGHVADKLRQAGIAAAELHGQLSQGRRTQALADFHSSQVQVLVATDLAARGIDVVGLAAVVNYDLPRSAVDYTHRIGRTGRAGAAGVALSFVCADAPGSEAHFRLIEKRQQQRVPREQVAGFEVSSALLATAPDPTGGVKGKRKSKKDKLREAAALSAR